MVGLAVLAVLVVVTLAINPTTDPWLLPYPPRFSAAAWRAVTDRRELMADDLVTQRTLIGRPRAEVIALLGVPEARVTSADLDGYTTAQRLEFFGLPVGSALPSTYDQYLLGVERSFPWMDEMALILTYSPSGRVVSAEVGPAAAWSD
jgi:hypothetical protein